MSADKQLNLESSDVKKLDIRGKLCPLTFIYTKLALEEMHEGEILEILLDFPPAIKNVPDNCKKQGLAECLEALSVDPNKKIWKLILKKL